MKFMEHSANAGGIKVSGWPLFTNEWMHTERGGHSRSDGFSILSVPCEGRTCVICALFTDSRYEQHALDRWADDGGAC